MHHPFPRYHRLLSVTALLAAVAAGSALAQSDGPKGSALKTDMRRLWQDHVTWTRLYIVSAAASLPEKDATAQRLLRNQEEIGNAVKPYYGGAAGEKLTGLLKEHITIATEVIDAAMKADNSRKENAAARWSTNADEIAALLSGANPDNWPLADLKAMLRSHLDLTTQEVVAHLGKDWAGSIAAYDKVHEQALMMADALSDGIARQFPEKVK